MYKNDSKFTSTLIWSILGLVFGLIPAIFWILFFIICLIEGELVISVAVFSAIFSFVGILFTVLGIRGLCSIALVSSLNRIFERDPDGIIGMDTILEKKGKRKGSAYERRILRALEKDYFEKLTYDRSNRIFELSDKVSSPDEYRNRFIGRNCPNCGAPLKIKKGYSVICDKCGQEVKG